MGNSHNDGQHGRCQTRNVLIRTMKLERVVGLFLLAYLVLTPVRMSAQSSYTLSDQWAATDALGRKLPDESQTGSSREGKYIGMFYWTWHTDDLAAPEIMDITQILKKDSTAATNPDNPLWKGYNGGTFWWDQPLFGYYRTTDEWVLRKHAEMLADAGVDVVFFDCTNGSFTWKSSYTKLLEVWEQARLDGVNTPKVAFILPFAATPDEVVSINELYTDLYEPKLYTDLWFMWKGKPLIMAYPELTPQSGVSQERINAIKNFFTFRPGQPDYVIGPWRNDQWGWLEDAPQNGYAPKAEGGFEQATVGVAQNASDFSKGKACAFNLPVFKKGADAQTYGRSYTQKNGQDSSANAYLKGLNFQEQWDHAHAIDPDLIFVTGWNEWTAGRWSDWGIPMAFVDQYSAEKSRDIEPVKSWGNMGDVYYMQLVSNVRKFKGMAPPEVVSEPKTVDLKNLEDWNDVKPAYKSYKGNVLHRQAAGQGKKLYINNTGRNDIVGAKVARDDSYVYFYVETADNLTKKSQSKWMRLFIDIDRNKATGWEGYDFIVNRTSPDLSAVVEKSASSSWDWQQAGTADYEINGKTLVIKIKRSLLGVNGVPVDMEFKWSDNMQKEGDVMDFYVNGDAAPGGRFNYIYSEGLPELARQENDAFLTAISDTDGIVVKGVEEGAITTVYSETGEQILKIKTRSNEQHISLPRGSLYFVKSGDQTVKVAL